MQVPDAVRRVQQAYPRIYLACHTEHVKAKSSTHRLSARDSSILAHLSESSSIAHAALAKHLGLAKSTLTEAMHWLEQCRYVERVLDASDARNVSWRLTAAGSNAMTGTSVLEAGKLERLCSHLTPDELDLAVRGLEVLAGAALRMKEDL